GGEDLEDDGEPADLEDLLHDGREARDHQRASLGLRLLSSEHEDAKSGTADVVDLRQIEDQLIPPRRAALEMGTERVFEALGTPVVDPSGECEHDRIGEASQRQFHRRLILTEVKTRGEKVFTSCSRTSHAPRVGCIAGERLLSRALKRPSRGPGSGSWRKRYAGIPDRVAGGVAADAAVGARRILARGRVPPHRFRSGDGGTAERASL